ncbi:MAG: porin family protein [Vicinamibacterales bacterium]
MKQLIIAAAIVASVTTFPVTAFAQDVGVKGGANFAKMSGADDEFVNITQRLGLVGGVWVRTPVRSPFSFQVEALLSEKGFKFEDDVEGIAVSGNLRIRYIEVPLLARVDLGTSGSSPRAYVLAGAAPAFRLGDGQFKVEADGEEETADFEEVIGEELKSFDLGLIGAAGVEFGRALVEARYTHGLMAAGEEDDSPKHRVFSVMVGFRLR